MVATPLDMPSKTEFEGTVLSDPRSPSTSTFSRKDLGDGATTLP